MTLREILQIELWSKRTTRRILVWLAVVFGSLILVLGVRYWIEYYWLTSGERRAGREALAQVEEVREVNLGDEQRFNASDRNAKEQVQAAEKAARTARDWAVAFSLDGYLASLETREYSFDLRHSLELRKDLLLKYPMLKSEEEDQDKLNRLNDQMIEHYRAKLHRALN